MKKLVGLISLVCFLLQFNQAFPQEDTNKNTIKSFEVYRVVGKGKDLKESREDAYLNAIIEFLRKNVAPKDLKENSEKILKEIFASRKITNFIESHKIISSEDLEGSVKIIIDVVLRTDRLFETLEKAKIPLKKDSKSDQDTN